MSRLLLAEFSLGIGDRPVVSHLTQKFLPGEIWAILGRNGTGKTTFLKALCGLYSHYSGDIFLEGRYLEKYSRKHIAQKMAILMQQYDDHFPVTVLETVINGRYPHINSWGERSSEDKQIAMQALAAVGLASEIQRSILTLSGGERRRLGLATVLTQEPEILLLDEPFNHVDIHHQMSIVAYLRKLAIEHQKTIIMVLHDINLVQRFCTHVLSLHGEGRFSIGRVEELLSSEHLYQVYQQRFRKILQDDMVYWYAA